MGWLTCSAGPAFAASGRLADFSLGLTTTSSNSPTGLSFHVFFRRADNPSAKPPALRSAVIRGPSGLRFDTSAVEQCTASDAQMRLLGPNACPSGSRLTVGSFSALTGFGPPADPLEGDDHVFNGPNQLIEIITFKDSSVSPAFDRLTISGATLTAHPPAAAGGPPDGNTAVRSLDFAIPVRRAGGRSLVTTPPACPSNGRWSTTATFGFADGSTDTVVSQTPCRRPSAQGRPGLRLAVRPRRVRAGRPVRLRFRVRSAARNCISGARVRLGGRSARTNALGRAALTIRFGRRGLRRVRATSPGCRGGRARLRVLRRKARRSRARGPFGESRRDPRSLG